MFPVLYFSILASATAFLGQGYAPSAVVASHLLVNVVAVAVVERFLTYEPQWLESKGDLGPDVIHLFVSNIGVSAFTDALLVPICVGIAAWASAAIGMSLWPTHLPLVVQGVLAAAVSELGYYWWHRSCHERDALWRFHSVHHSAPRLYWLNAVRFHPVDGLIGYVVQALPLVLLGAGPEVIAWHAIFLGAHGPWQHSNIDLKLGPLKWVFSMNELHRWHHSTRLEEGNTNYGGTLILWDIVFGTRFDPDYAPSSEIGVGGMPNYPASYWGQLLAPFRWTATQLEAGPRTGSPRHPGP